MDEADRKFIQDTGANAARKLAAQRRGQSSVWFGLGMLGMVGWSVAAPTIAGALLGGWLDRRRPGPHSWTLELMLAGLMLGCANAWRWVARENRAIHDDAEPK